MANDNHSFSIEDAQKYGVEKALIINHFRFFLKCHQSNSTHQYDGYTWVYNTAKSLNELMPYLNTKSISRWLMELEKDGVLISGNYNKLGIDKTKWYTMNEFAISQNEVSIAQNSTSISQNEVSKAQNEVTIPIHSTIQSTIQEKKESTLQFQPIGYKREWGIPFMPEFKAKLEKTPAGQHALNEIAELWETWIKVRYKAHNRKFNSDISEAQALKTFLDKCKGATHAIESLNKMIAGEYLNAFTVDIVKPEPQQKSSYDRKFKGYE